MKTQLFVVFLTLLTAPSIQYTTHKVAKTDINQAPWLVSLRIHGIHYCSGAIINNNTVVTVRDCMIDDSMYYGGIMKRIVTVKVGSSNLYDNSNIYTINKCGIRGPLEADGVPTWDLSMIRINGYFNVNELGAPKAIPLHYPRLLPVNIQGNVISWGYKVSSHHKPANLATEKWSIIDENHCRPFFNSSFGAGIHFCAFSSNEKGNNSCTIGDIGDPLVVDGRLVGLRSYKNDCQLYPNSPSVFVKINSTTFEE